FGGFRGGGFGGFRGAAIGGWRGGAIGWRGAGWRPGWGGGGWRRGWGWGGGAGAGGARLLAGRRHPHYCGVRRTPLLHRLLRGLRLRGRLRPDAPRGVDRLGLPAGPGARLLLTARLTSSA